MASDRARPRGIVLLSFAGYKAAWLWGDLIAGLMLAAIAIPEQIATAQLADMPAQAGLYAFAAGSLAFAIFGASRYVSVGADSTIAPIFASGIAVIASDGAATHPQLVAAVALIAGVALVLAGLLRAGWIADLISTPVTTGILAGISVHIAVGQLPLILGIPNPQGSLIARVVQIAQQLSAANGYDVAIGVAVFVFTIVAQRISLRIPGALIGLLAAGIAVATLGLQAHGVRTLDALPATFPALTSPFVVPPDELLRLVLLGLIVALVCMVQTSAVLRAFPSHKRRNDDVSREFAAVGAGSIVASFIGGFAVDASPPRTAIVQSTGGHSQLTSLVAVAVIALLVAFAAGFAAFLPLAALGGVLISIALRIFRVGDMMRIARAGDFEIVLTIVAALLVILLPIEVGMILAIVLSLVQGIYVVARPPSTELELQPDTTIWWPPVDDHFLVRVPGIVVFAPAAPIAFTNAQYITQRLVATVDAAPSPVRLVVIEGSGIIYIDYTGSLVLQRTIQDLTSRGIVVALARLSDTRAQASAERTGVIAAIGADHVFKSVHEAVAALAPSG